MLYLFQVVPFKRFNDVIKRNGVGLTFACMGMTSHVDGPADGSNLTGVGEIRLLPDLSTKWMVPWYTASKMFLLLFFCITNLAFNSSN